MVESAFVTGQCQRTSSAPAKTKTSSGTKARRDTPATSAIASAPKPIASDERQASPSAIAAGA